MDGVLMGYRKVENDECVVWCDICAEEYHGRPHPVHLVEDYLDGDDWVWDGPLETGRVTCPYCAGAPE